jgi:Response regulator containing CheY-like receiver, AAA-type ATPase, and DNA-binding domains
MGKPTILLVDDEESLLNSLRTTLELTGYRVLMARNEQEALDLCRREVVHLVVIDIRLRDNNDPNDFSGLLLANKLDKLDPTIHIIILTGRQYEDPASLILRVVGTDDQGHRLASDFVWKRTNPAELHEKIRVAFKTRIHVNPDLDIKHHKGLTWRTMVEQIKMFRDGADEEKRRGELVLEDLVQRLFYKAKTVDLFYMEQGQGPCTVVKARPKFKGPGSACVIKFGPRQSIDQEAENYEQYVKNYSSYISTHLESAKSRDMGAIVYKYLGGEVEGVISFHDYYRKAETTVSDLLKTLDHLFKTSCRLWYSEPPPPEETEEKKLDVWYREQLNLHDQSHINKLKEVCDELIEGPLSQGSLSRSEGRIHLRVNECGEEVLPDPVAFALEQKSSKNGSDFFPFASKVAITHGDLHSKNLLVDDVGKTWLIDFYKTGLGPALRDFAELESDIKFDLLATDDLCERYELEKMLLGPKQLNESIKPAPKPSDQQARALTIIQRLRDLAYEMTRKRDAREYYMALLFYALKRITGFTSSIEDTQANTVAQYHALISAAMICRKLSACAPGKEGSVFLAHAYHRPWKQRIHGHLKKLITSLNYEVHHPLDGGDEDLLWSGISSLIEQADVGFYEITPKNGNVYFELGYAIGHRKRYFALIEGAQPSHPDIAPLLQGLLMIQYRTVRLLGTEVKNLLKDKKYLEKRYFFNRPQFREMPINTKYALLIAADTSDQQKAVARELLSATRLPDDWQIEAINLKQEVNIEQFFLKALHAELVVGCFSPQTDNRAKYANAELALALGMAHGINDAFSMKKTIVILQEEGSDVLTDLKSLIKPFPKTTGAAAALRNELQARFTERLKNESA